MTFLVFLWGLSLLIMSATVCYISFRNGSQTMSGVTPLRGVGEFVRDEIHHFILFMGHFGNRLKPHTSRIGMIVFNYGKRGHVAFSERLFGRIISERGKTASFFLKYIAEHKENNRSGTPERVGY